MNINFRNVLKYDMPSTIYSNFTNVGLELLKHEDETAVANITLENFSGINKLIKELGKDKFGVSDSRVVDTSYAHILEMAKEDNALMYELLSGISFEADSVGTKVVVGADIEAEVGVYLRQPRGNNSSFRMKGLRGFSAVVQNYFMPYPSEGFSLAFEMAGSFAAVTPEALAGVKGSGALYLYVILAGTIFKADITNELEGAQNVMALYKG